MENDRLDRIEAALLRLTEATEAGFSGATEMLRGLDGMVRGLDGMVRGLDGMVRTLTGMVQTLSGRVTIVEGQMTEALGRLRIIGERLATHSHEEGG